MVRNHLQISMVLVMLNKLHIPTIGLAPIKHYISPEVLTTELKYSC
jgi:hypothetical protein